MPFSVLQMVCIVLLVLSVAITAVFDVTAALMGRPDALASTLILGVARSHPILPFLAGLLAGHLFWPQ